MTHYGRYEDNEDGYRGFDGHANGGFSSSGDSRPQNVLNDYDGGSSKEKDRTKEKHRSREREREREGERDRSSYGDREHDRVRDHHERDRSFKRERGHVRSHEHDHHHGRDYDRHRDRDYGRESRERDGHHTRKSRSPSRSSHRSRTRSPSSSRTRSRSRSKSKRISGFDLPPPNVMVSTTAGAGQPTVGPTITPGVFPNMFGMTPGQFPNVPIMPFQAMTQQATRHARRVYVGGLSPTSNEQSVATFFSQVMAAIGGNSNGPGDAVVNVYINREKMFAFVEMRSVEEASNAMALDGIIFEGAPVKVRRPTDYNPALAATLGPTQPNPNLNLAAVGLALGSAGGLEGPDRIFVGGLPYYFTEAQVRELLESFGPLRGFDLVKDRETGNSKGYAFCVYKDVSVTDIACAALNGIKMGDKTLTVKRANQGISQPRPEQEIVLLQAQQQVALQRLVFQAGSLPTKVLCLMQVVNADELRDDQEYEDILEDMRDEGEKYGKLVNIIIPRPGPNGEHTPGLGKVFLEYADTDASLKAKQGLSGRKFDRKEVVVTFYPENKFAEADYE